MSKLVYITGLAHSGSTLLEMLLSSHPQICGLGEVHMLLSNKSRHRYLADASDNLCSCGQPITECSVWSEFITFVETETSGDVGTRYAKLLRIVYDEAGNDAVVCDSSKSVVPLRKLADALQSGPLSASGLTQADLLVLHLVRDVRGYVASMRQVRQLPRPRLISLIRQFYRWHRKNAEIETLLAEIGATFVRVCYEQLCFNPHPVLAEICCSAGIEKHADMGALEKSFGHTGLGNPMRNHNVKSRRVVYDYRWFHQADIQLLYLLLPGIRRYNERVLRDCLPWNRATELFEPGG